MEAPNKAKAEGRSSLLKGSAGNEALLCDFVHTKSNKEGNKTCLSNHTSRAVQRGIYLIHGSRRILQKLMWLLQTHLLGLRFIGFHHCPMFDFSLSSGCEMVLITFMR